MSDEFLALIEQARQGCQNAASVEQLERLHTDILGRKGGKLSAMMASLAKRPKDERAHYGRLANEAKSAIEAEFLKAWQRFDEAALDASLGVKYDVTFPGIPPAIGQVHVLRRTLNDIVEFFHQRGFAIVCGPEIETEYYNFEAMNIPADHPARDSMDTFYLPSGSLLRTHTSPMQIRSMLTYPPPIAVLVPGKVYRRDALDARHSFMFHQIEGLHVDRGITFAHLKGFAIDLCRHLFGKDRNVRFRPSYFQFTEPSAEVDVSCAVCKGSGCPTCGGSGWLEIGGSGMVHPNVLRAAGYDAETFTGWAWGLGLERIAMLRYGIDDIRLFTENDIGFLDQFA